MIPYALITEGSEHNPNFYVGTEFKQHKIVPRFGVACGNTLQLIIFFDLESADFASEEIKDFHKINTEVFNLVTMETVK